MKTVFIELPVTPYYHAVLCGDCDVELIPHPDKEIAYLTNPIMFPYVCPKCSKEICLTEGNKPQVKFRRS